MANPTQLSPDDYNALRPDPLNNMSITSNLMGSTFGVVGRIKGTNKIVFYGDIQGNATLVETSSRQLSLGGVDLNKSAIRYYYTYDIGMDPVQNTWSVTVTGPAGNSAVFKKSGVGGDARPPRD